MSDFYYNDGGRVESGRRGIAGDCAVRAMAIALELDYDACYKEIAQANKDNGRAKSVRHGVMKDVYGAVLKRHDGVVIARQARHFVAVIDGAVHDIWNCSHKMVYGYWAKK
jgi:hypothetical protein